MMKVESLPELEDRPPNDRSGLSLLDDHERTPPTTPTPADDPKGSIPPRGLRKHTAPPPEPSDQPNRGRHRSLVQKAMLSKALANADTAVLMDYAQNIDGAIAAYTEACDFVQEFIMRSSDADDRAKFSLMRSTYVSRIAELHNLNDSSAGLSSDDLPTQPSAAVSMGLDFLQAKKANANTFDSHSEVAGALVLSPIETFALFQQKITWARRELERDGSLAGAGSGLTLDLSKRNISDIPDEVVDIMKDEVVRLALSNNHLRFLNLRFSECYHLRYLNIRRNDFEEIPRAVHDLPMLEILDAYGNKITRVPKDIQKLTRLRIFVISNNEINDLPTEMGGMTKLEVLKIKGNPLKPELQNVLYKLRATSSSMSDKDKEVAITSDILRYLRASHSTLGILRYLRASHSTLGLERPVVSLDVQVVDQFPLPVMSTSSNESHDKQDTAVSTYRYSDLPTTSGAFRDSRSSQQQYVHEDAQSLRYVEGHPRDSMWSDRVEWYSDNLARSSHCMNAEINDPRSSQYEYIDEIAARSSLVQYAESDAVDHARFSSVAMEHPP